MKRTLLFLCLIVSLVVLVAATFDSLILDDQAGSTDVTFANSSGAVTISSMSSLNMGSSTLASTGNITANGSLIAEGALDIGTAEAFTDSDGTPDVSDGALFTTSALAATVTDFDGTGILTGQVIVIESAGATTFDVSSSGLKCGSTDLVTADGDLTTWIYNGTDWLCIGFMDLSDDAS